MTNLHIYNVLDEENLVHKMFLMYSEAGIFTSLLEEMKINSVGFFRKENRLFHTAKEYVDDMVSFDNLGIGNFYGIFKLYFAFCSLVLVVFVVHSMANSILSRRRRTDFIICLNFQSFVNIKNRIVLFFSQTFGLE